MADNKINAFLIRLYLFLGTTAFVTHLIGFCTPYWRSLHFKYSPSSIKEIDILVQGFDEGIWRRCVNGICADINVVGRDWLQAVRVFEILAVGVSILSTALIIMYFFVQRVSESRTAYLISFVSSFVTAISIMLSCIIYGVSVKVGLSWSFGFTVTGGITYTFCGFLMLTTYFNTSSKK